MRRSAQVLGTTLLLLLVYAVPSFAAAEGEGGGSLFFSPIGTFFRWLQFALIFGGAGYLIAKKAPEFFRRRRETIVSAITESTRAKEDADKRLREAEAKIAHLDAELAELRATAQKEWSAEAERIRLATREEAHKIERAAQAEIEAAERAARVELRAMAARLAVENAEAVIRKQMTPQAEAALVRGFVENLGRSAN